MTLVRDQMSDGRQTAYIATLLTLSATHLLNDLIQSLIPAIYSIIKDS